MSDHELLPDDPLRDFEEELYQAWCSLEPASPEELKKWKDHLTPEVKQKLEAYVLQQKREQYRSSHRGTK